MSEAYKNEFPSRYRMLEKHPKSCVPGMNVPDGYVIAHAFPREEENGVSVVRWDGQEVAYASQPWHDWSDGTPFQDIFTRLPELRVHVTFPTSSRVFPYRPMDLDEQVTFLLDLERLITFARVVSAGDKAHRWDARMRLDGNFFDTYHSVHWHRCRFYEAVDEIMTWLALDRT